jgi:hypothetical protein
VETRYDFPLDGPDDEESDTPDLELPRCKICGHEISTVPVVRVFEDNDPLAMWSMCDECVSRGEL